MDTANSLPEIIIIVHFINSFCIILLIRSGLQILADHPMLYWTDDTTRENFWIKFGKKKMPKDRIWTAHDEAENIGHYALPGGGHKQLGSARNWHFAIAILWIITGIIYWTYLFTSGEWKSLIPTNWNIFPAAWGDFIHYLHFQAPPISSFQPFDPLQQLSYAFVVFVLPILMILTALAMSPAFTNHFPRYTLLFGGKRQAARSLHFIGMLLFSAFIIIHVALVCLVYFSRNVRLITLGSTHANLWAALIVFFSALLFLLVFNVLATYITLNYKVEVRKIMVSILNPIIHLMFGHLEPKKTYKKEDISPFFRVNGYPPETEEFKMLSINNFKDWKLRVYGLIENELELSLDEIKSMPYQEQITKHICIQGWSAIGEWGGLPMREILKLVKPYKNAKYIVFYAYDVDGDGKAFYEALRVTDMLDNQSILAYEMNWNPLDLAHGAPLRLRCERKLGYKMVKYIKGIEFVEDFAHIGEGRGGYREDNVMFDWEASI